MSEKLAKSEAHKRLVRALADYIKTLGFDLKCSSSLGLDECEKTKEGYIPDLKAYNTKESVWLYGEAKTEDDIDNDHTRAQLKSFSGHRMNNGRLVPCYLAITKGSEEIAWKVIKSMDLTQDERDSIKVVGY